MRNIAVWCVLTGGLLLAACSGNVTGDASADARADSGIDVTTLDGAGDALISPDVPSDAGGPP
ncbi:MAG: hypothetical protein WCJ30_18170, partial [Deltaproteobacteria bacterium]